MDYRTEVLRTANINPDSFDKNMALGALGLAGESGEVVDLIKKGLFHGKPWEAEKIIKEMGDVYWYLEYLAIVVGTTEAEIKQANVAKLRARFPDGFSNAAANAKADEARQ